MKKFLFTMSVLITTVVLSQRWVDLANIYWRTSPSNSITGYSDRRHFNMYSVDAKMPIVLNDREILIIGLEYQRTEIKSIPSPNLFFNDYSFSSSMLQLGWEHKWNDRTRTLFMLIPRMNTDFNDMDIDHFQMGGLVLTTTTRNENFDWKYGLYYNSEFFGPMFVPLFGFNWKINEELRFKMIIPLNLELSYQPEDWLRMGLRFDGVNASYKYQFIPGESWTNRYIDRADNNAWAFAEFHLGANIWFHLKAGHSVLRKYRFFTPGDRMTLKLGPKNIADNRNFDNPKSVFIWFENGWSFETRFIYRLPF